MQVYTRVGKKSGVGMGAKTAIFLFPFLMCWWVVKGMIWCCTVIPKMISKNGASRGRYIPPQGPMGPRW